MATDKPRYSITVDDELFKKIEDYRYNGRFPTRNEATIELIQKLLEKVSLYVMIKQSENNVFHCGENNFLSLCKMTTKNAHKKPAPCVEQETG